MKRFPIFLILSFWISFGQVEAARQPKEILYTVNLNDRADDLFKVSLDVKGLSEENNIYQFAATAPGTYQTMDIGRFVKSFKAYDKKGREISVEQLSTNQWKISNPKKVRHIEYSIAETFDTPVNENKIYEMCGTSIENDHVLINGQGVFGYFHGLQDADLRVQLQYPNNWLVGTALDKDKDGYFLATDYDHIVDSPILLGRLTKASTDFKGTTIELYTYSKTDKIKSDDLLVYMKDMLQAANDFVVDFPVDRYTFLFHFEDKSAGAWEHSYSSEYVLPEADLTPEYAGKLTSIAAHEFFHIITPLNIHSEIIETFNFVQPTPSEHLWLYEGTTEWASHMMQLRGGLYTLEEYLNEISRKLFVDENYFDKSYSLSKLSLTSYTPEGQRQYGNIYYRGALVAGLLDIKLLELSKGQQGLREVVNQLSKEYGPAKAFSEKDFMKLFVDKTYPEIADFFQRYVKNAEPLPIEEYFAKLGIQYYPVIETDVINPTFGFMIKPLGEQFITYNVSEAAKSLGLQNGDILTAVDGAKVDQTSLMGIAQKLNEMEVDSPYALTIKRNGEEKTLSFKILTEREKKPHQFKLNPEATSEQIKLREVWAKNL